MEGEIFSILGICALLIGIIISLVSNIKYNGNHNTAQTGYRDIGNSEKTLTIASVIVLTSGYVLSLIGFAMNNDSLHYTAKTKHHHVHSHQ